MIKVYNKFDDMPSATCFIFKKLFGDDVVDRVGFAVSNTYRELYGFTKIIGHSGYIEWNQEDFTFNTAPEFYLVIEIR